MAINQQLSVYKCVKVCHIISCLDFLRSNISILISSNIFLSFISVGWLVKHKNVESLCIGSIYKNNIFLCLQYFKSNFHFYTQYKLNSIYVDYFKEVFYSKNKIVNLWPQVTIFHQEGTFLVSMSYLSPASA